MIRGLLLFGAVFSGCKAREDASAVKVTNGVEIPDDGSDPYKAVVRIRNVAHGTSCTATFVTPRVVLTAAHCLMDKPDGAIAYGGNPAVRATYLGVADHAAEISVRDLALVEFGSDLAPATLPLYGRPVAKGDRVTFVGFGMSDVNEPSTLGTKRYGTNVVAGLDHGLVLVLGAPAPADDGSLAPGSDAASATGDSGGPLLIGGAIAGTVSGGSETVDLRKRSLCVDLASAPGQELLAKAAALGYVINGP